MSSLCILNINPPYQTNYLQMSSPIQCIVFCSIDGFLPGVTPFKFEVVPLLCSLCRQTIFGSEETDPKQLFLRATSKRLMPMFSSRSIMVSDLT